MEDGGLTLQNHEENFFNYRLYFVPSINWWFFYVQWYDQLTKYHVLISPLYRGEILLSKENFISIIR